MKSNFMRVLVSAAAVTIGFAATSYSSASASSWFAVFITQSDVPNDPNGASYSLGLDDAGVISGLICDASNNPGWYAVKKTGDVENHSVEINPKTCVELRDVIHVDVRETKNGDAKDSSHSWQGAFVQVLSNSHYESAAPKKGHK